jgi:hypothetical protein
MLCEGTEGWIFRKPKRFEPTVSLSFNAHYFLTLSHVHVKLDIISGSLRGICNILRRKYCMKHIISLCWNVVTNHHRTRNHSTYDSSWKHTPTKHATCSPVSTISSIRHTKQCYTSFYITLANTKKLKPCKPPTIFTIIWITFAYS